MPQYTSTETQTVGSSAGTTITAVLDTEANTITYTVTRPTGQTATVTQPSTSTSVPTSQLIDQLRAAGVTGGITLGGNLTSVTSDVKFQASRAEAAAKATDTPPPENPTPPPPVTATENPNADPNTNIGADGQITSTINSTENVFDPSGTAGVEENVFNPKQDIEENVFNPGTTINAGEENVFNPKQDVEENVFNPGTTINAGEENVFDPTGNNGNTSALSKTQGDATNKDALSFEKAKDWRVRLSLAPSAKYLYKADNPGILKPLAATNGVIFPYTPTVSAVYSAAYDSSELVHSNYKIYNYKNSSVDTVTITGDFTAQDTNEANYLLAVIHFFKSVTKMFYGQDENPRNGVPPPLVYMNGLGTFQFDNHPLAVTNFTYSLPNEVDYIRAGSTTTEPGNPTSGTTTPVNTDSASSARIMSSGLGVRTPNFQRQQASINSNATYVPTKMQIVITCIPIVTRNDISNKFSLRDYATGKLLQGSKNSGGGIW